MAEMQRPDLFASVDTQYCIEVPFYQLENKPTGVVH